MVALAEAYPDDIDVQALAADALVNITAWALWDISTGEPAPGSRVVEAKRILDDALATPAGREHPMILHLYLHTMEMSATPQDALPAADLLRNLVPDAGHLVHMPSHIDVLCGNYRDAVVSNLSAVQVDRRFVDREGPLNFYSLYRAHNLHFVVYSAMFEGSSAIALQAADELSGQLSPELLAIESPPMADWLEAFVPLRIHVLVRFGRWDELIAQPLPEDVDLYCSTATTIHYGRGVAHAAKGQLPQARAERDAFAEAYARIPDTRYLFNNTARDILAIAGEMLDGEIDYREGRFDDAFAHLRRAIELDDSLPYDEPWGWMQPTRHAYGALLLEQGVSRRPPRCTPPTSGWTQRLRGRVSTLAMSGACTATTNACNGWAAPKRRRSSVNSSNCSGHARTCRSWRPAHAGSRSPSPNRKRLAPARSRRAPRHPSHPDRRWGDGGRSPTPGR